RRAEQFLSLHGEFENHVENRMDVLNVAAARAVTAHLSVEALDIIRRYPGQYLFAERRLDVALDGELVRLQARLGHAQALRLDPFIKKALERIRAGFERLASAMPAD